MAKISLGVLNRDLDGRTLEEAKRLVSAGEARWVHARFQTLKLVPVGYQLEESELFVAETDVGFSPV